MTPDERAPFEIRVKTALVVLGIFLAGAATGAGIYRWTAQPFPHHPPLPFVGGMFHELGLSAAQETRAREIGERHRPELDTILRATFPKVRAIHEQMEKELRDTLTPEQQQKFDELKAHRRPHHPPGGMMPHGDGPGMHGWGPPPPEFFPPPAPAQNPPKKF